MKKMVTANSQIAPPCWRIAIVPLVALLVAAGCKSQGDAIEKPSFSGERAFELLVAQCDFGPRPPKSAAIDSLRAWFVQFLDTLADTVYLQHFSEIGYEGEIIPLANVIASFNARQRDYRILLLAHFDTHPWAEKDPDSANHLKPIMGANDGASGVAVLLHLAELLHRNPPPIGVDIFLTDGEDYGREDDLSRYLMGSKYFARNAAKSTWKFAILLDMIGEKDVRIPKEQYSSLQFAPDVVDTLWARAKALGLTAFIDSLGKPVIDDHHPLAQVGIKAVDLIDFDYPYWHTMEDTPDKCSPLSLEQVGKLLVDVIYAPPKI